MILQILRNPRRKKSSKRKGTGSKSQRKAIRSLEQQVEKHEDKLHREPHASAVRHWQHEIEILRREIAEREKRL